MKSTMRIYILLTLLLAALQVSAQGNDPDATVKALAKVIRNYPGNNVEPVVDDICKKFKKNPAVFCGVANAFWYNAKDSARAFKYADRALSIDSKYVQAYVLKGDIMAYLKDTVTAERWYEKAINVNPQSPLGYKSYASVVGQRNPKQAADMLEKAKENIPSFPYHVEAGRLYYKLIGKSDTTYHALLNTRLHYGQAEVDSMTENDTRNYVIVQYMTKNYDKVLDIANSDYAQRFADDPYCNRYYFYSAIKMELYGEAEKYATRLFAQSDSITNKDYDSYVLTLFGLKKYDDAIALCEKWMKTSQSGESSNDEAMQRIAEAYEQKGEFVKAEEVYTQYVQTREESGKLTVNDMQSFVNLYLDKGKESNGQEMVYAYTKADSLLNIIVSKFVTNADEALYKRYKISVQLHPDPKDGYAVDICKQLISLLKSKSQLSNLDNEWLVEAYYYLAYNNLQNDHYKDCKKYALKILEINPEHEKAKEMVSFLKKYRLSP